MRGSYTKAKLYQLASLRLLSLDVDGVLADGRITYTESGEMLKSFNALDGHGVKMLQESGIKVAIISGRNSKAVERRACELGIELVYLGVSDKGAVIKALLESLEIRCEHVGHIGDDLPDLAVFELVGVKVAVPNAVSQVIQSADFVTERRGGEGAVREFSDLILNEKSLADSR